MPHSLDQEAPLFPPLLSCSSSPTMRTLVQGERKIVQLKEETGVQGVGKTKSDKYANWQSKIQRKKAVFWNKNRSFLSRIPENPKTIDQEDFWVEEEHIFRKAEMYVSNFEGRLREKITEKLQRKMMGKVLYVKGELEKA